MTCTRCGGPELLASTLVDRQHRPLCPHCYSELHQDDHYRQLGDTQVGEVRVSTVWLGIVHLGGLFETMIFGGERDGSLWRYQTEVQAVAGHDQIVAMVRADVTSPSGTPPG